MRSSDARANDDFSATVVKSLSVILLSAVSANALFGMEARYPLLAPVVEIVEQGRGFEALAGRLACDAVAALARAPAPDEERRWLGLTVHLALLAKDDARAQAAARRLQALQADDHERAYTGMTTFALGAVRRADGSVNAAEFGLEFARQLNALPKTVDMRAVLIRQRNRLEAITPEVLAAETRALAARVSASDTIDWETADAVARLRHRRVDLLPLRREALAALVTAIAVRQR